MMDDFIPADQVSSLAAAFYISCKHFYIFQKSPIFKKKSPLTLAMAKSITHVCRPLLQTFVKEFVTLRTFVNSKILVP